MRDGELEGETYAYDSKVDDGTYQVQLINETDF